MSAPHTTPDLAPALRLRDAALSDTLAYEITEGIGTGSVDDASGSDIGPLSARGVSTIELCQDATRYFDLHHTADDTLDKVDLPQLRQNVAAWTAMLAIVANAPEELALPVTASK